MELKLAYISNYYWPVIGGMETQMQRTIEELARRKHMVEVHTTNTDVEGRKLSDFEVHNGVKIYRYPFKFYFGYYCSLFIPQIREADLINLHGFGFLTNDFVAWKYAKTKKCVLATHHGVIIPTDKMVNKIYHTIYRNTIGIWTLRKVHLVGTNQELDRKRVLAMGIPERKVTILQEAAVEDNVLTETYKTPCLPEHLKRFVVFVGRLHTEKSPAHLLLALKKIGIKDLGIVFIGPDGGEQKKLKKLAENLGLHDRVVFAGKVPEKEKYAFLAHAEFLVLPSYYEGFGAVILESWAMSKPVIASRVGGVPYIVSDGKDGLLYDWGDIDALAGKMKLLLENEELRKKMGMAGRRKVEEKYTRTKVVDRIEAIYKQLLETKS
ncbi:MAG: glycosyltransferase family 4 protein [Thermoplasmata archaeon]|nr:glycosyltransferase family 4 protein [Thermoplasmata archaeon]